MKKKLEADLTSIAHRILKLKNKEDIRQLHLETQKLYEKLTVLLFIEENFEEVKPTIGKQEVEEKISSIFDNQKLEESIDIIDVKVEKEEIVVIPISKETTIEKTIVASTTLFNTKEDKIDFDQVTEEKTPVVTTNEAFFDKAVVAEKAIEVKSYQNLKYVDIPKPTEFVFDKINAVNLNDKLKKSIDIGLNDKIAFEKNLFGGSTEDYNRVISQISTFDSLQEAQNFINNLVKPDYNNWENQDEFANRFMEIVENKFS